MKADDYFSSKEESFELSMNVAFSSLITTCAKSLRPSEDERALTTAEFIELGSKFELQQLEDAGDIGRWVTIDMRVSGLPDREDTKLVSIPRKTFKRFDHYLDEIAGEYVTADGTVIQIQYDLKTFTDVVVGSTLSQLPFSETPLPVSRHGNVLPNGIYTIGLIQFFFPEVKNVMKMKSNEMDVVVRSFSYTLEIIGSKGSFSTMRGPSQKLTISRTGRGRERSLELVLSRSREMERSR